jgi:hypothetical protein
MSFEGRAFLKLFCDAAAHRLPPHLITPQGWNLLPEWTAVMLGSSASRKQGDFGLLGAIGEALRYTVETEYLRVDQTWSSVPRDAPGEWIIEAFIEHENNISNVPATVRKIMHLGLAVKIIITYPGGGTDEQTITAISAQIAKL